MDRGWGKAAQLVDVQGEVRRVVEVKLSVVQAQQPLTIEHDDAPRASVTPVLPPADDRS
jgi:hypothetical protein